MSASLRHISASLLLALYLPIALALPFFHSHIADVAFGGVPSYSAQHISDAEHGHAGECPACKFASSHWMPTGIAHSILPGLPSLSVAVPYQELLSTLRGLPASRAPPAFS